VQKVYDLIVIGAGIAGCSIAYTTQKNQKEVLIIDKASTPATGGSGAAGAFISPKLGKESTLLNLTNLAFDYSSNFYKTNFPNFFDNSGIARVPKDAEDEQNLEYYKSIINAHSELLSPTELKSLGVNSLFNALYFKDGGVCDAENLCKEMVKDIDYLQTELNSLVLKENIWEVNSQVMAKNIVLATGYTGYKDLLNYMGISGLWGSRGDFYTSSDIKVCMHQNISVSALNGGVVKIGATHVKAKNPCMVCDGKPLKKLIDAAKELADIDNLELKETFCGMRSTSRDHFPTIGKIIDANYMLNEYPNIKRGYNKAPIKYFDNLYVFNGLGGRGFVYAPLMAKWLYELIFEDKEIESIISPDRLFLKWARRLRLTQVMY